MNNLMPCFTDSQENRFPDEPEAEEESPLTDIEKRIEWLLDEWKDAITDDTYDTWRDIRMMCYGATQTVNHTITHEWLEWKNAIDILSNVAFERSLQCIHEDRYAA